MVCSFHILQLDLFPMHVLVPLFSGSRCLLNILSEHDHSAIGFVAELGPYHFHLCGAFYYLIFDPQTWAVL